MAEPSRDRLVSVARVLGVTVGWLADGEETMPANYSEQRGLDIELERLSRAIKVADNLAETRDMNEVDKAHVVLAIYNSKDMPKGEGNG